MKKVKNFNGTQLVHTDCGTPICAVLHNGNVNFACSKCNVVWEVGYLGIKATLPKDMVEYTKHKKYQKLLI